MTTQSFLLCFIGLVMWMLDVRAEPVVFQSGVEQISLIELYTSEGCSSCPPAETWLSKLKDSPGLWTKFVPLAFHVNYWDNLGWRDPWANKSFSDRQRNYAQAWSSDSVYTPAFVLNGKEWQNWFGWRGSPASSGVKIGSLAVNSPDNQHWRVRFVPVTPEREHLEVHAALLISELNSDVKAGENRGRRLNHDFVVVTLTNQPLAAQGKEFHCEFSMDTSHRTLTGRLALAAWVTRERKIEPVQAVGGWLTGGKAN